MSIPHILLRSPRRKTLQIEILPTAELLVRAPKRMSEHRIMHFLQQKEEWIRKKTEEMRYHVQRITQKEDALFFLGRHVPIRLHQQLPSVLFSQNTLFFSPAAWENRRQAFERFCRAFLRKMAEKYVSQYASSIHVSCHRIRIGNAKTRWGSCSTKKNITLSWRLVLAPEEVIAYVIAHEVAHLQEMNHSKKFWRIVECLCPEYERHKMWLKTHGYALSAL